MRKHYFTLAEVASKWTWNTYGDRCYFAMVGDEIVKHRYGGYTKREADRMFRDKCDLVARQNGLIA